MTAPPSRTELLERDRDGKITGKMSAVWVRWIGELIFFIASAGVTLPILESDVTNLVTDLAALTSAISSSHNGSWGSRY